MEIRNCNLEEVSDTWMDSERILATPSALAKEALFYVQETGTMTCKHAHDYVRESLDSYLLLMVLEGTGTLSQETQRYTLRAGDIAFVDCHKPYCHSSSEKHPWKIAWIHWNGKALESLYELFRNRNDTIVRGKVLPLYLPIFQEIQALLLEECGDYELFLSQKLYEILMQLLTDGRAISHGMENTKKWEEIHQYIEAHFTEKITLEGLSQQFHVSKYYMLREFKKQYHVTIIQFMNQCRMNYAKKLLRFTDWRVEKIAEVCGIRDASYFNRVFRTTEGISACEFRKRWQN